MREVIHNPHLFDLPEGSEQIMSGLASEFNNRVNDPVIARRDPYSTLYYQELNDFLATNPEIYEIVAAQLSARPELSTSFLRANLVERVFRVSSIAPYIEEVRPLPDRYKKKPGAWARDLQETADDYDRLGECIVNLRMPIQSSLPERGYSDALLLEALEERLGREIVHYEIGCGLNVRLKKQAGIEARAGLRFEKFYLDRLVGGEISSGARYKSEPKLANDLHERLAAPRYKAIRRGTDMIDIRVAGYSRWAATNSFYLSEITRDHLGKVMEHKMLRSPGFKPANVEFEVANLLDNNEYDPDQPSFIKSKAAKASAHLVTLCAVLYEVPVHQQPELIDKSKELLREDGVLAVQDFAIIDPKDPSKLITLNEGWRNPNSFRTFVWDNLNPGEWQEVMIFDSGRMRRVKFGAGRLVVSNMLKTMPELLFPGAA